MKFGETGRVDRSNGYLLVIQFSRFTLAFLAFACQAAPSAVHPQPAVASVSASTPTSVAPASSAVVPTGSATVPVVSATAPASSAAPASSVTPADDAPDVAAPREHDYEWMSRDTWWQRQRALLAIDPALKRKSELVFLGDSITEGWDDAIWTEFFGRYHPVRLGLGGDKTQQVLFRIEHGELAGLRPKVLVLLIGTNNFGLGSATPAGVASGVTAVVRAVQAKLPSTRVLLLGILPRDELADAPIRSLVSATNAIISKLDDGKRVHYLDISASFTDASGRIPVELMADFLHPTPRGYRVFAAAIAPALRELLSSTAK